MPIFPFDGPHDPGEHVPRHRALNLPVNSIHLDRKPIILGDSQIWNNVTGGMHGFEGGIASGEPHAVADSSSGDAVFFTGPIAGWAGKRAGQEPGSATCMSLERSKYLRGDDNGQPGTLYPWQNVAGSPAFRDRSWWAMTPAASKRTRSCWQVTSSRWRRERQQFGLLDLNGDDEIVAGLTLAGGRVQTGAGTLTALRQRHPRSLVAQSTDPTVPAGTLSLGTTSGSTNSTLPTASPRTIW